AGSAAALDARQTSRSGPLDWSDLPPWKDRVLGVSGASPLWQPRYRGLPPAAHWQNQSLCALPGDTAFFPADGCEPGCNRDCEGHRLGRERAKRAIGRMRRDPGPALLRVAAAHRCASPAMSPLWRSTLWLPTDSAGDGEREERLRYGRRPPDLFAGADGSAL